MRRLLSGIQTRVTRLAERIERQALNTVDWEELIAILHEGRRRSAAGIQSPQWTAEEFAAWADELRASVRGRDDTVLVERLIAGRQRAMQWATTVNQNSSGKLTATTGPGRPGRARSSVQQLDQFRKCAR